MTKEDKGFKNLADDLEQALDGFFEENNKLKQKQKKLIDKIIESGEEEKIEQVRNKIQEDD